MDLNTLQVWQPVHQTPQTSVYYCTYEGVEVAVKKLSLSGVSKEEAENEVETQRSLTHPNICSVLHVWSSDEFVWIVLEWMQRDVAQEIDRRRQEQQPWSHSELWHHFAQILDALCYAQQQGISHRDIKPQNLFLASDGSIKIGDFGTAKFLDFADTQTIKGSPYFMSPEMKVKYQCAVQGTGHNESYNPYRSDVYSLGVTFLYMLLLAPSPELLVLENLQATIDNLIQCLPTDFQVLFRLMLAVQHRVDFLELRDTLWPQTISASPLALNPLCRFCQGDATVEHWTGRFCSEGCVARFQRYYQQDVPYYLAFRIRKQQS